MISSSIYVKYHPSLPIPGNQRLGRTTYPQVSPIYFCGQNNLNNHSPLKEPNYLKQFFGWILSPLSHIKHSSLIKALSIPYKFNVFNKNDSQLQVLPAMLASTVNKVNSLAIGDMHASYQKLLETLVASGLARMPHRNILHFVKLSQELSILIDQDELFSKIENQKKAQKIYQSLKELISTLQWTGGNKQLILIGDMLGDRGPLDLLCMDILEQIKRDHPERVIHLASNHDHTTLSYFIEGDTPLAYGQQNSLLRTIFLEGPSIDLIERYRQYIASSKLMHYNPKTKTLYTHAPISVMTLKNLIEALKDEDRLPQDYTYEQLSEKNLPQFVETANHYYQDYIRSIFKEHQLNPLKEEVLNDSEDGFLWNRSNLAKDSDLPLKGKGVQVLVHGHDLMSNKSPFSITRSPRPSDYVIINLDQHVRKIIGGPELKASPLYVE
jgi:hypothetical protein